MAVTEYVAGTIPARVLRAQAGITLFDIGVKQFGDPLQWVAIAQLNGLVDPWIMTQMDIKIPPVIPSGTQSGILGL